MKRTKIVKNHSLAGEHAKDNTKMYEAVKNIKHLRPPQKRLIKGKNGLTANPAEQSKIMAKYFKEKFYKNSSQEQSYHRRE